MHIDMRKKVLILLSGFMIGSALFAVPKKRKANNNPRLTGEELVMMFRWFYAQPTEGAEAEYYRRIKEEALECVPIGGRYDRLMLFERIVNFPLRRRVSQTFLSLLKYYLPDDCANAKAWRNGIATMMLKFRSGRTNIAKIKAKMRKFCVEANGDESV